MYVARKVEFCASHRLHNPQLSEEENRQIYGCCNNPHGHGHNYVLEVMVKGKVDPQTGMVINLNDLKRILEEQIVARVDHRNLNLDVPFMQGVVTTAENLIKKFWEILEGQFGPDCSLYEMRLWESENNLVVYRGEEPMDHPV